ncbi:MAG: aminomethyl-transferring glycine dehydrogenase subunit GcvPA [Eubacteriales bacterium]|nr:aminomethyl-transferring glycine dehydrogenase subunit GcvPA [Eubacteriales bacterium]
MKSYVPHTEAERREMLATLGLGSLDELYADVPEALKLKGGLKLPAGMSEAELRRHFAALAAKNTTSMPVFRGAGAYRHYIPSAVPQLAMRSEFYTAYTPYQAEMSQGMLQAIFEYQTFIAELTGLDASNASVYDGASAAAEAMLMLRDAKRKHKVLYSAGLMPDVKGVLKTYARFARVELVEIPLDENGLTDRAALLANAENAAGFIAAQPNFYGCLEDMQALSDLTHGFNGLFVAYVNPISLGLLKRPGEYGADIAIGEGQPLGVPLSFGGSYVGFMASTAKLMRSLPGRIAGETQDADGNRVFVLTLQAREQHIRREKASSSLCSNQMLCALMASIYLSLMGKQGLKEAAEQCVQKAHYLAEGISRVKGLKLRYPNTPFFHEFAVDGAVNAAVINAHLKKRGIVGGVRLSRFDKNDSGALWCATELNTRDEIDSALNALEEVCS